MIRTSFEANTPVRRERKARGAIGYSLPRSAAAFLLIVLTSLTSTVGALAADCTAAQCATQNCPAADPYVCTKGSAKGGCQSTAWNTSGSACSEQCDSSKCGSAATPNPVCTQAQCDSLQTAGKFCKAWGADATPYACATTTASEFGGCSASPSKWQPAMCGGTAGCNTQVCNWNMTVPQSSAALATAPRAITFDNQCSHNIQVGYVGGAVNDTAGKAIKCTADGNECPAGSSCLKSSKTESQCYWTMPTSFDTARNLKPKKSSTITLANAASFGKNNTQVTWSGNVWAHTQCDANFANCKTAICPDGGCAPSTGPTGPVTLAEFTLQNNAQDYYDVSVINGVNVPITMAPTKVQNVSSVYPPTGTEGDYWCGAPGSTSASNALKASSWNVGAGAAPKQLPFLRYVDTTGFGQACNGASDPACPSGSVCGLSYNPNGDSGQITLNQCGKLIGWWTADEICGVNPRGYSFADIDCLKTLTVPGGYPAGSYPDAPREVDMLLCRRNPNAAKGVKGTFNHSCYSSDAKASACCGCENWAGITSTGTCTASNQSWQSIALPWLKPLKAAVPTAYSYPYDDKTSTFTCYQEASDKITVPSPQQANKTAYTITFCPGGLDVESFQ